MAMSNWFSVRVGQLADMVVFCIKTEFSAVAPGGPRRSRKRAKVVSNIKIGRLRCRRSRQALCRGTQRPFSYPNASHTTGKRLFGE